MSNNLATSISIVFVLLLQSNEEINNLQMNSKYLGALSYKQQYKGNLVIIKLTNFPQIMALFSLRNGLNLILKR